MQRNNPQSSRFDLRRLAAILAIAATAPSLAACGASSSSTSSGSGGSSASRPQLTVSAAALLKTAFTAYAQLISQAGFLAPPSQ